MKRNMKKGLIAALLSTSMITGMSMTALADDPSVEAPIYALDVTNVVVPTVYQVAFNPGGLTVKTDGTNTSTAQILSKNYGIINKSSKDKIVKVSLKVEDLNNGKISFKDNASDVTNAAMDEFAVYLAAVPADTTEVKIGTASADKDTAPTALNDVVMTAATGKNITLKSGDNKMEFFLEKATLSPKVGNEVTLGTTTGNDVSNNYEVTALAGSGKGITAFSFTGSMNTTAAWEQLTSGIKITPVYTSENAPSGATAVAGTGALYEAPIPPEPSIAVKSYQLTAGTAVEISVNLGTGDTAATRVSKVMDPTGVYDYLGGGYATYDATNKKLTLTSRMVDACISGNVPSVDVIFDDDDETSITITLTK